MDKLIFIGKNYLDHAQELGDAVPDKPVIFIKPPSVLKCVPVWGTTANLILSPDENDVHYEAEIVLHVKKDAYQIAQKDAGHFIDAVSLGLDMTRRNLQTQLKKQGHPWTIGKVFPDAAIVGPLIPIESFTDYLSTPFSFSLNDKVCQKAQGTAMTFSPAALVSYVSEFFPLCAGDLIFTGTPSGVGQVKQGDRGRLAWGERYWYDLQW
ncbi:MAG: fumarylacetoacetate hydrolase family protein [Legionellales bacterium]|nr:fumarylacetoacetate hydrolase family protein [Legionellales bacterium]